jgi:single-stranded-DNA-specific exonuclease
MAAGLSLEAAQLAPFRHALWRTLERTAPAPEEPTVEVAAYLPLERLTPELAHALALLAPYGPGNERPVFATSGLELARSAVIGRTREHRRVQVRDAQGREATVLWWRSTDRSLPSGSFDLAYTVGLSSFRGQEDVQITWVDARMAAPPAVEVAERALIPVRDLRGERDPEAGLRAVLLAQREQGRSVQVWGEGRRVRGVELLDRGALQERGPLENHSMMHEAETLVIWTAPPGPGELQDALAQVSPREVILFGVDPGLDAAQPFLRRLGGLAKYGLREYGGRVTLAHLAAAMAHSEPTVRLGLEWLACRGQIAFEAEGEALVLRAVSGHGPGEVDAERLRAVEGALQVRLEETAAYRRYFRRANAEQLINEPTE